MKRPSPLRVALPVGFILQASEGRTLGICVQAFALGTNAVRLRKD